MLRVCVCVCNWVCGGGRGKIYALVFSHLGSHLSVRWVFVHNVLTCNPALD